MTAITTPEFSEKLFTTRTVLYEFDNEVDLLAIAKTLPLKSIVFTKPWKRATKPKLKEYPAMGTIYSIRMINYFRGVYGPYFKNSLMIDISLETKSVNVKISRRTIHICGVKEKQHSEYIADLLQTYIMRANTMMIAIDSKMTVLQPFFEWIKNVSKGDTFERDTYAIVRKRVKDKNKLRRQVTGSETVHQYRAMNVNEAYVRFPDIDRDIITWIVDRISECSAYEDMLSVIAYLQGDQNKRTILSGDKMNVYISPKNVMINCSFSLGFCVRKTELRTLINTTQKDFVAHFNKASDHYVNVELLPSKDEEQEFGDRDSTVAHTFIVYESGYVMMSSKLLSGMKEAFYRFRDLIEILRPQIIDEYSSITNASSSSSNDESKQPSSRSTSIVLIREQV